MEYIKLFKALFKARSKGESYASFRDSSALPSHLQRCSEKSNKRAAHFARIPAGLVLKLASHAYLESIMKFSS